VSRQARSNPHREDGMIDCELLRDKGILLITPEGPLAAIDFQ
jgi:hypothetical protein